MINVTCAIIRNEDDEVLVVQRGEKSDHPFKWEFPGGKVKEKETDEECIIREINEELSIDVVICRRLPDTEHDYGYKQVRLIPFVCDTLDDIPFLTEHLAYKWLDPDELKNVDLSEADISVAHDYLKDNELTRGFKDNNMESAHRVYNEEDIRSMVSSLMGIKEAEWVAESAIENMEILRRLIEYSFSDDKKLAFHASWTLSKVYDKYPEVIQPDLQRIIESLDKLDNESVQRSFLRMISMSDLKMVCSKHHGILADHCFKMLRSGFSAVAVKAYSMEIIYRLAQIYPELANELSTTINMLQGDGSTAGILARGHIILKKLAGKSTNRGSNPTLS
jgi:8-oxo-dGTP diphosphatase